MDDYMVNMTVSKLKEILASLPDDMPVIIPVIDYDDVNAISGFRHIRTAGILACDGEKDAVCLNGSAYGLDISSQIKYEHYNADTSVDCKKILF